MNDEVAATNRARWNALVDANVEYTRPMLDLTPASARSFLDPSGVMDARFNDVQGKDVLCLAGGGGQQGVAFALLGAHVTVFDISDNQLSRDRAAAEQLGLTIHTIQGDMRDLSAFGGASFDVVYHAYSITFVPRIEPVLTEVARICRPGALYRVEWSNPFTQLIDPERDWTGEGYTLRHPYVDGFEATTLYPTWTVDQEDGSQLELPSPREFVHTLATMINTLAEQGFVILHASEYTGNPEKATPGNWHHFASVAVPFLTLWARYQPDQFPAHQ
jgi:ubiquinone/menaquinone biosynthesis C-methylase UbiE